MAFEEMYISLRVKENRVYSDKQLLNLPNVDPGHAYYKEWLIRKRSCRQLQRYLTSKKRNLKILEIGCGNGWFAAQLLKVRGSKVTGIDINESELAQAERVFGGKPGISFISGDIRSGMLKEANVDIIVFAASVQYFPSLKEIVKTSLDHLAEGGEIHILDTPFYLPGDLEAARQRTVTYYASMGFPGMADHYFHHGIDELKPFRYEVLYNASSLLNKLVWRSNPFPWICVKRQ